MLTIILILGALPWLLILLYHISHQGFVMLLIWLFIAPVVSYWFQPGKDVSIFQTSGSIRASTAQDFYDVHPAEITLKKLFEPTRIMIGMFLGIGLLTTILKREHKFFLDRTEILMSVFSLILLVNILLWSRRLAFGLHVATDAFIVPFLAYYLARRLVTREDRFRQLTWVIGYMGVYIIAICLIESLMNKSLFHRLRGPFESGNTLHVVMAVVFFVVVMYSPLKKPPLARGVRVFLIIFAPVIIFLTVVRGNWVGFLSGLVIFLYLGRRLIDSRRKIAAIGLAIIFVLLVTISAKLFLPWEFIEKRAADRDNVAGRFATWVATLKQVQKGPLFGIGLNNLHGVLSRETVRLGEYRSWNSPHNAYLSILVELGVIGLATYLAIVASIVHMGLRLYQTRTSPQHPWCGITVVALMVTYQVPSLFANTLYVSGLIHIYLYVFMGAIAGLQGWRRSSLDLQTTPGHCRGEHKMTAFRW